MTDTAPAPRAASAVNAAAAEISAEAMAEFATVAAAQVDAMVRTASAAAAEMAAIAQALDAAGGDASAADRVNAVMQFEDVLRQQGASLKTLVEAVAEMDARTLAEQPELPRRHLAAALGRYVSEEQRAAHARALGEETYDQDRPRVQLF